ncbi:hypothetical protein BC830DRAFT_1080201 [Chytriomyces sp. MP71]|nr:hypothetical protein BC830DRAFT_1080201 [Chytriomyces sp. MP71]
MTSDQPPSPAKGKWPNPNNLMLSVTNLYAMRAITLAFAQPQPPFAALGSILALSMFASIAYHFVERRLRSHPYMEGKRLLGWISEDNEESVLLAVDRVLSVAALAGVAGVCGFDVIKRVAIGSESWWVLPAAFGSAVLGELGKDFQFAGFSGYAWAHGCGWHVLVYHLPYLCIRTAIQA